MATEANAQGLTRYIPADIRRVVRKRCGFGCVICGLGFYDYEHFSPDFADATSHDPTGITLLCMQCNHKRARGQLSRERVAKANEAPACKLAGYTRDGLDLSAGEIRVEMGSVRISNCPADLVSIAGLAVLSVRRSDDPDEPLLLSGTFTDIDGLPSLEIVDNQWFAEAANWDVEVVGSRITIRRGHRDIALQIKAEAPHTLKVEKLNMSYRNWRLEVSEERGIEHFYDAERGVRIDGLDLNGAGQVAGVSLGDPGEPPRDVTGKYRRHVHQFGRWPRLA